MMDQFTTTKSKIAFSRDKKGVKLEETIGVTFKAGVSTIEFVVE